jgi:hypothetical protein
MVRGAVSTSVTATVKFCECSDSDIFAQVYVSCDGSCNMDVLGGCIFTDLDAQTCADIVPVWVIGCKLFEGASFHKIHPYRDLQLSGALQMGRVGGNESLGARNELSSALGSQNDIPTVYTPYVTYTRHVCFVFLRGRARGRAGTTLTALCVSILVGMIVVPRRLRPLPWNCTVTQKWSTD